MSEEKQTLGKLSRKEFVKRATAGAAGIAAASALTGCGSEATPEPTPTTVEVIKEVKTWLPEVWDQEVDVIVLGFGGAGAAAAIEAHEAGSTVLLVEKTSTPGGSTAICGGLIAAAGTSDQAAEGITDTPEEFYDYWMEAGEGLSDPELARLYTEKNAETVEWLKEMGTVFTLSYSGNELKYPNPKKHGHTADPIDPPFDLPTPTGPAMSGGTGIFVPMYGNVLAKGIDIAYETKAVELVADPATREVLGVKAESNGATQYFRANKGVIIATGNFHANEEMIKQYTPKVIDLTIIGVEADTGDGLKMAQALGADLVNMDDAIMPLYGPGGPTAIWVNKSGQRFVGEDNSYEWAGEAVARQSDRDGFGIFDEGVRESTGTDVEGFHQADSIEELATMIGIDPTTLANTVNTYNAYVEAGEDQMPFAKREENLVPLSTPPFYASPLGHPSAMCTGGMKINVEGQVIDVFGRTIPRLYAAGSTTGGAIGFYYPCSGACIGQALTMGRIAGSNAAALESWS